MLMNPFLLSVVKENFGVICALIGFIVIFATIKITQWQSKLNDLEPARIGFQSLSDKVDTMLSRVDDIWKHLLNSNPLKSSSPISLTEIGEEISKRTNAKTLAKKHVKKLMEDAGDSKLNAFEIQTRSMDFAANTLPKLLSSEEKDMVENEAFQRGMGLEKILEVIGVELRDIWLEHSGLDVSRVDNKDRP